MPSFYTYFISSLPMLHFEQRPPFNFGKFLEMCAEFIPEGDLHTLKNLALPKEYSQENIQEPIIAAWVKFDTSLRNELVKARAQHLRIEGSKYLRQPILFEPQLAQLAVSSHRNPSLVEAERMLDRARWDFLDGLSFGHYFDLDFLIIYACKLKILERWESFRSAQKETLLETALGNK